MASHRVLKLPCSDQSTASVLLHTSTRGPKPLDLKLEATEGQGRYVGKLHHDRVASLRVNNSSLSESDWQSMLESVFNQEPLEDIQAAASIQEEESLSITIRKEVQGVTQRLGSITLKYDMGEGIQLYDWCETAAAAAAESKTTLAASAQTIEQLENEVQNLKSQLDELITAKDADESVLLQKFRDLLNEKKVKIRQQQKIINSAPVESSVTETSAAQKEPQETSGSRPTRKAAPSRSAKRKTTAEDEPPNNTAPDVKMEPEDSDHERMTEDTASTASESDAGDSDGPTISDAAHRMPPPSRQASGPKETANQPPVRRNLPFINKKRTESAAATSTKADDEETDSDDEL